MHVADVATLISSRQRQHHAYTMKEECLPCAFEQHVYFLGDATMGVSRGGELLSEISSKSNQVVPELVETHRMKTGANKFFLWNLDPERSREQ